jgi:hypothetical protein
MYDKHRESASVKDTGLESDIEHNQLYKTGRGTLDKNKIVLPCYATYPLQLIKAPIAPASRQLKPVETAAAKHGKNFALNETKQRSTVYAHAVPVFNADKSVLRPESVKYYCGRVRSAEEGDGTGVQWV